MSPWRRLACKRSEVRLDITLRNGQSFRWTLHSKDADNGESSPAGPEEPQWIGVLRKKVWIVTQDDANIYYKTFPKDSSDDEDIIKDYLQLNVSLMPLYEKWSKVDPIFKEIAGKYGGVRMLRQDPPENLFSFICSSNNNIQRISAMVESLCTHYGDEVYRLNSKPFYSFPSIARLAEQPEVLEKKLAELKFGYRAGFIAGAAKQILEKGGEEYLMGLREKSYVDAKEELLQIKGIGPKVADCILLMSLDKAEAVPIDTHMLAIAARDFLPHLRGRKSVTDKVYKEIGDHFRKLYGDHAGWAHTVLFSADLKHLKELGSEAVKAESEASQKKRKRIK